MKETENTQKVKAGQVDECGKLIFLNVYTIQMVHRLNRTPIKIQ